MLIESYKKISEVLQNCRKSAFFTKYEMYIVRQSMNTNPIHTKAEILILQGLAGGNPKRQEIYREQLGNLYMKKFKKQEMLKL